MHDFSDKSWSVIKLVGWNRRRRERERGGRDKEQKRRTYVPPDISARWYLYTADRKAPASLKVVAWCCTGSSSCSSFTPSATSNHHESPFRIADPRGTTDSRGRFSRECRGFFRIGNPIERALISRCGSAAWNLFPERMIFLPLSSHGLSATNRPFTGEIDTLSWIFDRHFFFYKITCIARIAYIHIYIITIVVQWVHRALYRDRTQLNDK